MTNSAPPSSFKPFWALLTAVAVAGVLWWHATIVAPFVLSLVLAYALEPVVERMVRLRIPRTLAVALCLTLVALVVAVLLVLLIPIVSQLVPMLRDQLPDLLVALWAHVSPVLEQWGVKPPTTVDAIKAELVKLFKSHAGEWSSAVWASVLSGGGSLMALLGLTLLVPMLAFYWLIDWCNLMARFKVLLPVRWRPLAHDVIAETDELMGQYLRGQVIVMLILAVYYSIGLSLFGFNLALPIGVLTGLAICIPYLGYGLGLVLASLAGLLQFAGTEQGLAHPIIAVALIYGLGQFVESFFLTPRLVGERIGLHPLGVIFALMLFAQWLGLWGVLIALPVSAFLMLLGRRLLRAYQDSRFYQSS